MKVEFKTVAHFYLGCKCYVPEFNMEQKATIISIHTNGNIQTNLSWGSSDRFEAERVKPILRPLSDMQREDLRKWNEIAHKIVKDDYQPTELDYMAAITAFKREGLGAMSFDNESKKFIPHMVLFLTSMGFDLFGLIESGEAVSAVT